MLATLRAHPLQPGESRVHGCCTHIQLECKHRALKNSAPQMPSPTTETRGAATHFPSRKLSEKEMCTNACAGPSHSVKSLVSRRNDYLFPIQPFPPEHLALWELLAHYSSHFTSSSKICLHNSQSQQLRHKEDPHLLWPVKCITFPLQLVESRSCLGLAKPKELVTTESI